MPGHVPVMKEEVIRLLSVERGGVIVDGTVGDGGHAAAILKASGPGGILVGVDLDPDALARARGNLSPWEGRFELVRGDFADLPALIPDRLPARSVLLDLGVNSSTLADAQRGFSFSVDGPLDMRMDPGGERTAADLVNRLPVKDLEGLFREFGEERYARRIARRIVEARSQKPLKRTGRLADIITRAVPRRSRIHPATRAFQALRIAVNGELERLERFLEGLPGLLEPDGRAVVVSFHSLEDRRVKRAFREGARRGAWENLTPKPLTPSREEIGENPRSRSAKLRAVRRIEETGCGDGSG